MVSISTFTASLLAGGMAGTSVDVALFPLDTLKTRIQSPHGFLKAGGFRGIYNGLSAAAAGSAPGAALFFSSYEATKAILHPIAGDGRESLVHMSAASVGETAACIVRVPTEIIKQRMQAGMFKSASAAIRATWAADGLAGFYVGYSTTLLREIPFSLIQFPLYEALKKWRAGPDGSCPPVEAAACGSVAGALAAGCTTPLDVAKTRLMLGHDRHGVAYNGTLSTLRRVATEEGVVTLFSGVAPRVMWIGIGGFVFFGVYEYGKGMLLPQEDSEKED